MFIPPVVRYMLTATFLFTLMNVFVKMVPNIPAVEVIFFRSLVSLVMSIVALRQQKVNPWGNNKKVLGLRGATGAVALILYFYTLQKIPLASAVTIQYMSPIFTTILGIFIVKERVFPVQWLFFAIAFSGIIVIEGFDTRISPLLLGLGMTSALFSGLAYNWIRRLNTTEHPLVIVLYFPLVTLPIASVYCLFNWVQPQGIEWLYLIMVGVLTQFAQYFMTKSYQSDELNKVASIKYLGIFFALGFGYLVFNESYSLYVYLGMALVLLGVLLNLWFKFRFVNRKRT